MWTATLKSVTKSRGMVYPVVVFHEDQTQEEFEETFHADDIDAGRLAALCRQRVASLKSRDVAAESLSVGLIDLTPPEPNQDQLDADKFFADHAELLALTSAADKGLVTPESLTALKESVAARLKKHPKYLKDFRWR